MSPDPVTSDAWSIEATPTSLRIEIALWDSDGWPIPKSERAQLEDVVAAAALLYPDA